MTGKIAVICPTVRKPFRMLSRYAKNAIDHFFDIERLYFLLITEDFCDRKAMIRDLDEAGLRGEVYSHRDRYEWLKRERVGRYLKLIPRRSHAETSFGLLWVLKNDDYEYVSFVDDDTIPSGDDFFGGHIANLDTKEPLRTLESSNRWVNVLHACFNQHGLYPRGHPYSKRGEVYKETHKFHERVVLSQGLWTGQPDLDAMRLLVGGRLDGLSSLRLAPENYGPNFVTSTGDFLTISSMNVVFRAEIAPYFYQLPMDDNAWKIGRFDDIWSGLILKKICDSLGYAIISGSPLCVHEKAARNIFRDLIAEVNGLELNERLGDILASIDLTSHSPEEMYVEIGQQLRNGDWSHIHNGEFLNFVGKCMNDWSECCGGLQK